MQTLYEQLCSEEEELTKDIPYFRIDNVEQYLVETDQFAGVKLGDLPSIRPPFEKLFMEYNNVNSNMPILIAVQVTENENWSDVNSLIIVVHLEDLLLKVVLEYCLNKNGQLSIWGNDSGNGYVQYGLSDDFQRLLSVQSEVSESDIEDAALRASETAIISLGLMSCNNVDRIFIEPRKGRKRHKSKNQYRVSYHVLSIRPMGTRKIYDSGKPTGKKQPFHVCRGHFKTFTDEAPLFGKHVGTYWWSQQARGKKEHGVVHKSYDIKEPDIRWIEKNIEDTK